MNPENDKLLTLSEMSPGSPSKFHTSPTIKKKSKGVRPSFRTTQNHTSRRQRAHKQIKSYEDKLNFGKMQKYNDQADLEMVDLSEEKSKLFLPKCLIKIFHLNQKLILKKMILLQLLVVVFGV